MGSAPSFDLGRHRGPDTGYVLGQGQGERAHAQLGCDASLLRLRSAQLQEWKGSY